MGEKAIMSKRIQETERETLRASLELEDCLERSQQERRPHRPRHMTSDQASAYQMAALFRVISPGATTSNPGFVDRLQVQVVAAFGNHPYWDKERASDDTYFGRR